METRASYVLVGGFVIGIVLAIVAFLIWLGATSIRTEEDRYLVYFTGSVTGLQLGSPVRYQGIRVGQVRELGIDPANLERVRVLVEVAKDTPIVVGVEASLELQSLTGGVYIELEGGQAGAPPLLPLPGDIYPVIPSQPSTLATVLEAVPDLLRRTTETIDSLAGFLTPDNQERLAAVLANAQTITGNLADQSRRLGDALDRFDALVTDADGFVEETRVDAARLSDQIYGAVDRIQSDFGTVATSFEDAAGQINTAGTQINALLTTARPGLEDFASTGLYEFTLMVAELRDLAENLSRVARRIEQDPAQFLLGGTRQGVAPE